MNGSTNRSDLIGLLERHGWRRERVFRDAERWLTPVSAEPAAVPVPIKPDVPDFDEAVDRIVARVAAAAGVDRGNIELELAATDYDFVRFIVETTERTIPLRSAVDAVDATRRLLTAALRSAERPRARYLGGRVSEAVAASVAAIRVAAPSSGSFALTVQAPLPAEPASEPPLIRRALSSIARVAERVASRDVNVDALASREMVALGASANLYEAVATLMTVAGDAKPLRLRFSFAPRQVAPDTPAQICDPSRAP